MNILMPFNSKAKETATIPLTRFNEAVWQNPDSYEQDDSITAHVLNTLGLSRLSHFRSRTFKLMAAPNDHIVEIPGNLIEHPRTLCGSAGVFMCAYHTLSGKRGAAVLIRDTIESLDQFNFGHHLLLAFAGVADPDNNHFHMNRLISGTFGRYDQLNGQETIGVSEKSAYIAMDYAKSCVSQILAGERITAAANLTAARRKNWLNSPEMLDKLGPNP
jgi:hypothetical protein